MVPYLLSAALTVPFYLLSVPFRRVIYPRLNWFLASTLSYVLAGCAFEAVLVIKDFILATTHISQDGFVCGKLGCVRVSDWLPILLVIVGMKYLEARSRRR